MLSLHAPLWLGLGRTRLTLRFKTIVEIGPPAKSNGLMLTLIKLEKGDPFSGVRAAAKQVRVKLQEKE